MGTSDQERSMERIHKRDLRKMAAIALADMESLCERNPRLAIYRQRLLAIALCQGGALHYLDHKNGLKDIDLWSFFAEVPGTPFPWRRPRPANVDYGPSKFGRSPKEDHRFVGRRVDLMGRSLPCGPETDPAKAIRTWLDAGSTSAGYICRKPVILIYPPSRLGEVVSAGDAKPADDG